MATFPVSAISNGNLEDLISSFSSWRDKHDTLPSNSINLTEHAATRLVDMLTECIMVHDWRLLEGYLDTIQGMAEGFSGASLDILSKLPLIPQIRQKMQFSNRVSFNAFLTLFSLASPLYMEYVLQELVQMMSQFRMSATLGSLCLTKLFHALDALAVVHGGFKAQIGKHFVLLLHGSLTSSSSTLANVMRNWASLSYARMELLNTLLEKSMKNKQILLSVRGSECELVKKLYRCVDGNSQLLLIESLWRLLMPQKKTEDDRIAAAAVAFKVIAHSHTRTMLIQQFLKITTEKFDDSLRIFMLKFNELRPNMSHSRSRLVWSFSAQHITIQDQKFANNLKPIWIDIGLYALTTRLPDPQMSSFHYTVSIPIQAITHHSLHSPHKMTQKGAFQTTQLLVLAISLDKISPDSATAQPLFPPDIIDSSKTKDISIEIMLSQKDADHFASLIVSRIRTASQTNVSTLSGIGSSIFSNVNTSGRASHHGGTIASELADPTPFKPRYSLAPVAFQPQAQLGPVSSSPVSKIQEMPSHQENDNRNGETKSSPIAQFLTNGNSLGMMDHRELDIIDVAPEPQNRTIDELLARLDDFEALEAERQSTVVQSPILSDSKHMPSSKSTKKVSAKKSSAAKTSPKNMAKKSSPPVNQTSPLKASFHESVANMAFGMNPVIQTPMNPETGTSRTTPKSPSVIAIPASSPTKDSDSGKKKLKEKEIASAHRLSPNKSTKTSPNSDTTAGPSPSSLALPLNSTISPPSFTSPASLVSQLSLYPMSPVPAPKLSTPSPIQHKSPPHSSSASDTISPPPLMPLSTDKTSKKSQRSENNLPKPEISGKRSAPTNNHSPTSKRAKNSSKKRKRPSDEEEVSPKLISPVVLDISLGDFNPSTIHESIDYTSKNEASESALVEESPPAPKRPKSAKKVTSPHQLSSEISSTPKTPNVEFKTPSRALVSTVSLRCNVPGAPRAQAPPSVLGSPTSPTVGKLAGDLNLHISDEAEALSRQLFPPEHEPPSSQIHMELQDHVAKLLTLIERESDAIASAAERRKSKLKEAWTTDLEEMRTMTHNAHSMLDKVFEIAANRAQDTIDLSGVSFEEFNAMSEQYQTFITKIVDATANRLATL